MGFLVSILFIVLFFVLLIFLFVLGFIRSIFGIGRRKSNSQPESPQQSPIHKNQRNK